MILDIKRPDQTVPSYSLTGDLLSFLRCKLQYRYLNGSSLPPSRPVQQWYGEFLHGTLELAYALWADRRFSFPWPCTPRDWLAEAPNWAENDIGKLADQIELGLRQQGKQARNRDARDAAFRRVGAAINELGPHLFPLISATEKKVIGSRPVPQSSVALRCSQYEVHGIIDVVTSLSLGLSDTSNVIRNAIQTVCPDLSGEYEIIVDYKGSSRPNLTHEYWLQGDWQVQTYAWLRRRQPEALNVAAGILVYVNEITPGDHEIKNLLTGLKFGITDVIPADRSKDQQLLRMWGSGSDASQLSLDFRLRRAIRVVPISTASIDSALKKFDAVVQDAEESIIQESLTGQIMNSWKAKAADEGTCNACDFRHFCPNPFGADSSYEPPAPKAP
jgi:CRISPR/Cas system-associated exonuclease Cas4 (RecB family)